MTTVGLLLLDHGVSLMGAIGWFAAGVAAASGRPALSRLLLVAALALVAVRLVTVGLLWVSGWWFAQEKVLVSMPMLVVAAGVASAVAWRPLAETARMPGANVPAGAVIAILSAAYAALAGVATTFVVGYPATPASALLTVCAVLLAVALTARALPSTDHVRAPTRAAVGPPRRTVLTGAGSALAAGSGGSGLLLSLLPEDRRVDTGGTAGHPPAHGTASLSVASLRGARTPAPGGEVVTHVLTAGTATLELSPSETSGALAFNGQSPGPAIVARPGDLLEVTLRNDDVAEGVTLHWHGYDVACGDDGVPGLTQYAVMPGEEFVYRFRAEQVGTYWYHTHQTSHLHVRKGLFGTLVVHPRGGRAADGLDLTLPIHTFGATLIVGEHGGTTTRSAEPGSSVRLRLVNTDPDPHALNLAGTSFRVVAVDGRNLEQPDEVSERSLRIPGGGRYDVALTMPEAPVALVVDQAADAALWLLPEGQSGEPGHAPDTTGWPELDLLCYGRSAAPPLDPATADRSFALVLDRGIALVDGRPVFAQTVNGRGHPGIPDQLVALGDLVTFTVVNRSLDTHPWHLHGHPVLVISRDGERPSGSPLWLDTFDVRPGEVWVVAFRATNPGMWMNHCHNLPHAHQGMMLRLVYEAVATPFATGHGGH